MHATTRKIEKNLPKATAMMIVWMILACCASSIRAQSFRGSIHGTVKDSSGAIVSGAKITLSGEATGLAREAIAGGDGSYVIPELPAGKYALTATFTGFAPTTYNAVVE